MRILFLLVFAAGSMSAQASSGGVSSEWDIREMLASLQARAKQLAPVLDQLKPAEWARSGAPQEYAGQWTTAKNELRYLLGAAETLAKDPEKLPAALDTLFRMQALDSTLGSVIEGTRKYQNPAIADLVQAIANENDQNRDRLKQYVLDLASEKEHELQVMDAEAQRCRASISNQKPQGKR
jgi:ABC-type transporter Mla subunit MlaD